MKTEVRDPQVRGAAVRDELLERARSIFVRAVELRPDERGQFVARACGDDEELRGAVTALLVEAHAGFDDSLGSTISWAGSASEIAIGTEIGPYCVLESLGHGGFAEVFLAQQSRPVRRRVALKILKRGLETKAVLARFEAERQALALMSHPCIAKVFDAGETEDGRPYFVLEYVPGDHITRHCDAHRLGIQARLELFLQVCDGIQHAHDRAIVHRDIKPSNVLVADADGGATPRIIDFGIAKAMARPLTDRTIYTARGQAIGTPGYMSPEQMGGTGETVDGRTDVYALGVLLYELLTGLPPFDPNAMVRRGFDEFRRIVRHVDPPKPSTRLSAARSQLAETARNRGASARALIGRIRGDLDWITMRAVEKDRARRYGSSRELGDDIQRHLRDEPIVAGPPGLETRLRKFLRRHRRSVLVPWVLIGAVGLLLLTQLVRRCDAPFGATLSGSVLDQQARPIRGALITVDGHPFVANTSTEGEFRGEIEAARRGDEVLLRVSHELYESATRWVAIESGRIDTLTFRLGSMVDEDE